MSKAEDHKKQPCLMSHPTCDVIHFPMLYIPNIHTYAYCTSHDIYLHVLWCTMLLPHALHAKLDPLSTQTLFPKPQPDAPIKGIQVPSMP